MQTVDHQWRLPHLSIMSWEQQKQQHLGPPTGMGKLREEWENLTRPRQLLLLLQSAHANRELCNYDVRFSLLFMWPWLSLRGGMRSFILSRYLASSKPLILCDGEKPPIAANQYFNPCTKLVRHYVRWQKIFYYEVVSLLFSNLGNSKPNSHIIEDVTMLGHSMCW